MGHKSVKVMQQRKKAFILVKAKHRRRVTTKVTIRIRIGGGLPAAPHTQSWQAHGQLDSNLISH